MIKWEYQIITLFKGDLYYNDTQGFLNRLGDDGWELTHFQSVRDYSDTFILKRQLQ